VTNAEIAATFEQVADLLEYQGGNVFRVRAYRNAARTIDGMVESLATVRDDSSRSLTDLEGVGSDLAEKIGTLLDTGGLPLLTDLQKAVPAVVFQLMRVPGLGPKKVKLLVDQLGIDSLDALEKACRDGQVAGVKGFGAKTQAAILGNIAFAKDPEHARLLWNDADAIIQELLGWMRACPAVRRIDGAGSWRRGRETVGDLDLLVESDAPTVVMDHLRAWKETTSVLLSGDTKTSIRGPQGVQIDLRVIDAESYGAALQYFTGSKEHNVKLRSRARDRGLSINEYGVHRIPSDDRGGGAADVRHAGIAGRSEADVYACCRAPMDSTGNPRRRRGDPAGRTRLAPPPRGARRDPR
jgi:DNA polymerase (family X)